MALLAIGCLVALLSFGTARAATVYPASPELFLAVSEPLAIVGDNVTIDVFAYANGSLADAASPPSVQVSFVTFRTVGTPLPFGGMQRVGTGHYQGHFGMPSGWGSTLQTEALVRIDAYATVGGVNEWRALFMEWLAPGLHMRLYSDVSMVLPLQPVHLTAELYNGTQAVDADPGSVVFYPVHPLYSLGANITPTRTALGVYEADAVLNSTTDSGFVAEAKYQGHGVGAALAPGYSLSPPYRPFEPAEYQAWFQELSGTPDVAQGYLWVADPWGRAAAGLTVNLTMGTNVLNTTTDAEGRIPITVDNGNVVQGTIGTGSPWALPLFVTNPLLPCPLGLGTGNALEVIPTDPATLADGSPRDFLQPGTTVVRSYHVVNPAAAGLNATMRDAPLTYYVQGLDTGSIYATGQSVADDQGNLTLSFTVPAEAFGILFDVQGVPASAALWNEDYYAVASPAAGLHVSPLTLGGATQVKATFADRPSRFLEPPYEYGMVQIHLLGSASGQWLQWPRTRECEAEPLRTTTGGLNATFFLPSFLPSSGRYLVSMWVLTGNELTEQYVVLAPGQSGDIPVGGLVPASVIAWLLIGSVVAAVGAVAVVVLLHRQRRRSPPSPPLDGR